MSAAPGEKAALQAARWFFLLDGGEATEAQLQACMHWRAASAEHELAWQRAQSVAARFGSLPSTLALPALNRTDTQRRQAIKALAVLITAAPAGWLAGSAQPASPRMEGRLPHRHGRTARSHPGRRHAPHAQHGQRRRRGL